MAVEDVDPISDGGGVSSDVEGGDNDEESQEIAIGDVYDDRGEDDNVEDYVYRLRAKPSIALNCESGSTDSGDNSIDSQPQQLPNTELYERYVLESLQDTNLRKQDFIDLVGKRRRVHGGVLDSKSLAKASSALRSGNRTNVRQVRNVRCITNEIGTPEHIIGAEVDSLDTNAENIDLSGLSSDVDNQSRHTESHDGPMKPICTETELITGYKGTNAKREQKRITRKDNCFDNNKDASHGVDEDEEEEEDEGDDGEIDLNESLDEEDPESENECMRSELMVNRYHENLIRLRESGHRKEQNEGPDDIQGEVLEISGMEWPHGDFSRVEEGLCRSDSWTVYPIQLSNCLEAAAELCRKRQDDSSDIIRFYSDVVPNAFSKCLIDSNVMRWNDSVINNITEAVQHLIRCTMVKASVLFRQFANSSYEVSENDECSISGLLGSFSAALNRDSCYQRRLHLHGPVFEFDNSITHEYEAPKSTEQRGDIRYYITFLIEFANLEGDGVSLLVKYLSFPNRMSFRLLAALLEPVCLVCDLLVSKFQSEILKVCNKIVGHFIALVEDNIENLSEKTSTGGKDYSYACQCINHLSAILSKISDTDNSTILMLESLWQTFINALFDTSSFQKQIVAVRELNKLIKQSHNNNKTETCFSPTVISWLKNKEIVEKMLKNNLHHRQYCDCVRDILLCLIVENYFNLSHHEMLWSILEKQDNFEVVRLNVIDMLSSLAWSMPRVMLDALLGHVRSHYIRFPKDKDVMIQCIRRLSYLDIEGKGAKVIIDFCWDLLDYVSNDSKEVMGKSESVEGQLLAQVIVRYARHKRSRHAKACLNRCIDSLFPNKENVTDSTEYRKHLLLSVLVMVLSEARSNDTTSNEKKDKDYEVKITDDANCSIEESANLRAVLYEINGDGGEVIIKLINCLNYLDNNKTEDNDLNVLRSEALSNNPMRLEGMVRYVESAIEYCLNIFDEKLEREGISTLWAALVLKWDHALEDLFYLWICQLVEHGRLSASACSWLLSECLTEIPTSRLSAATFACFNTVMLSVGISEGNLISKSDGIIECYSLDVDGIDTLWRFMLETNSTDVGKEAVKQLNRLYMNKRTHTNNEKVEGLQIMFERAVTNIEEALVILQGFRKDVKEDPEVEIIEEQYLESERSSTVKIERCLMLIKHCIDVCGGETMEFPPPHAATHEGLPIRFISHFEGSHTRKLTITLHTNSRIADLREAIAKQVGLSSQRVRIAKDGRNLDLDGKMMWQCDFTEDVIHVEAFDCAFESGSIFTSQEYQEDSDCRVQEDTSGKDCIYSVDTVDKNRVHLLYEQKATEREPQNVVNVGLLLARNAKIYDHLMHFARLSSIQRLQELSVCILDIIPTSPSLIQSFENALLGAVQGLNRQEEAMEGSGGQKRLEQLLHGKSSFIPYALQTLECLLLDGKHSDLYNKDIVSVRKQATYYKGFLRNNGLHHLLNVMQSIKGSTSRRSYICGLSILKKIIKDSILKKWVKRMFNIRDSGEDLSENDEPTEARQAYINSYLEEIINVLFEITSTSVYGLNLDDLEKFVGKDNDDFSSIQHVVTSEDIHLVGQSLSLMSLLFTERCETMQMKISSKRVMKIVLIGGLLKSDDCTIRDHCALSLLKVLEAFTNTDCNQDLATGLRSFFLKFLLEFRPLADNVYAINSVQYYCVWNSLAEQMDSAAESEMVNELLLQELRYILSLDGIEKRGERYLESRIKLASSLLVRHRQHFEEDQEKHVEEIKCINHIMKMLFPSSAALAFKKDGKHIVSSEETSAVYILPEGMCKSRACRSSMLDLLSLLCSNSSEATSEFAKLMRFLHLSPQTGSIQNSWEYQPVFSMRPVGDFVGLKNAGATCYMNAVFQQLFMLKKVREGILGVGEVYKAEVDRSCSILYQLQTIFLYLERSDMDHYIPSGFWKAFKDYDGVPVDVHEHQDAFEFLIRLLDSIDQQLRDANRVPVMKNLFGGQFVQQVICSCCHNTSEMTEQFMGISVDIRGKKNLEESLSSYVQGELLEADNAYYCQICAKKMDAVKRVVVKSLPKTLVIHLKRFEFDYNTMNRLKLKDYFEFPSVLNMFPYTVDGIEKGGEESFERKSEMDQDESKDYELCGVVVHSGTAFAGHYYSYVRDTTKAETKDSWYTFDDIHVNSYDEANMERDCFGGKYLVDMYDTDAKSTIQREYTRPNSAYMLIYESRDEKSREVQAECSSLNSSFQENGDEKYPESICKKLYEQNMIMKHEIDLLDPDYFCFVKSLLTKTYENNDRELKSRRVDYILPHSMLKEEEQHVSISDSSIGIHLSPHVKCISILLDFILSIVFHSNECFRGPIKEWISVIKEVIIANPIAAANLCAFFSRKIDSSKPSTLTKLVGCPNKDIRFACAHIFQASLNCISDEYWRKFGVSLVVELFQQALSTKGTPLMGHLLDVLYLTCSSTNGERAKRVLIVKGGVIVLSQWICQNLGSNVSKTAMKSVLHLWCMLIKSCERMEYRQQDVCASETLPEKHPNPYQINPVVASLDGNQYQNIHNVLNTRTLRELIYETNDYSLIVRELFSFLSWENRESSEIILWRVLREVQYAIPETFLSSIHILIFISQLRDTLQFGRLQLILIGNSEPRFQGYSTGENSPFDACLLSILEENTGAHADGDGWEIQSAHVAKVVMHAIYQICKSEPDAIELMQSRSAEPKWDLICKRFRKYESEMFSPDFMEAVEVIRNNIAAINGLFACQVGVDVD